MGVDVEVVEEDNNPISSISCASIDADVNDSASSSAVGAVVVVDIKVAGCVTSCNSSSAASNVVTGGIVIVEVVEGAISSLSKIVNIEVVVVVEDANCSMKIEEGEEAVVAKDRGSVPNPSSSGSSSKEET